MSNYDASIRIDTRINTKSAEVQLERLENQILKSSDKIKDLRSKMDSLKDQKIPTQEYQNLQKELDKATKEMQKMVAQDSKLSAVDEKIRKLSQSSAEYADKLKDAEIKVPTKEYESLKNSIETTKIELERLLRDQKDLLSKGLGKDSDKEYLAAAEAVRILKEELQEAIEIGDKDAYLGIEDRLNRVKALLQELMSKNPRPLGDIRYYYAVEKKVSDLKGIISSAESEMKRLEESGKDSVIMDSPEHQKLSAKYAQINQELEKQKGIHSETAQKQADAVQKTIELKGQMQQLVEEGKDFTLGQDTEQFSKLGQQLQYAENNLSALNKQHKILEQKVKKTQGGYAKLGDTAKKSLEKINSTQKKSIGLLGAFGKQLKSILAVTFIFNSIRKALNFLTEGIKEGFKNFYEGNEKFKRSIDSLKASATTLKNSLAAAFAPLVEIAIPYIQRFIDWLTKAVNLVGQFIAALTGRKTYTRAIKQTAKASDDAAKATQKEAEATEEVQEAAEGYLNPLDEINKYRKEEIKNTQNPKTPTEDEAPENGVGTMFEEIPIDNRILDFLQKMKNLLKPIIDYAKRLKDVFIQGFWDGLGDWEYRWESIKDSIASIKDSLIDIFTDPSVLAAADGWAQSVAYMLGSLAGSVASIGLTIATNLLGGIAKYLEQNKDQIKKYLVSMFDIWSEVNYMFADLFQSIAYVFEAFASEQGQQLTANIIGIFANAFMGITELASKIFRDLAQLIIKPFVDNKEGFRTALEGFLGVLAEVTGTIKQGIDDTFAKLNEVYDAYFKPFFDSVAQGLSNLVGKFLEFWNGNVQPILNQMAADFDALWQSHIQPLLNNAAEFLGKVVNLLKALWEGVLQPLIAWIIENILPKILPIIQAIWDILVDFIAYIADAINGIVTILGGIIDFLTGVFTGDWELAFQGLKDIVGGFIDAVMALIEGFATLISDAVNGIFEVIKSLLSAFVDAIMSVIETFLDWMLKNIINKGEEINQRFSDFFSQVKEKWNNGWNALKEKVNSIIEEIKSAIQSAFDWIAEKVNAIGEKLSSIGSKAKSIFSGSIFGGSSFSFSKSYSRMAMPAYQNPVIASLSKIDIPAYATGQVIPRTMKQHLAILGDNNRETEVVSPLSTMKEALKQALIEMGGANQGNGQPIILKVILDGKDILYAMVKEGKIVQMSTGKNIFALE